MFEEIKERLAACPPLSPYTTAKGGVVILNGPFPVEKARNASAFVAAAQADIATLLQQMSEAHHIIDDLQAAIRGMEQQIIADGRRIAELEALVGDFVDPDPCQYDHHGYCQAHGWFETEPACPHARAKALGE